MYFGQYPCLLPIKRRFYWQFVQAAVICIKLKYKIVILIPVKLFKPPAFTMINRRFTRNAYLVFSPFLIYYVYYIIRHRYPALYGDETRYIGFATNLLHGFYSPPMPHIDLWNGPGYPIVLMPFIALHVPFIYLPLINAVFTYLSAIFLYKALCHFINPKWALLFGIIWAVYPNMISMLTSIYTEPLTAFIVTSFIYSITLFYKKGSNKYLLISGLLLGFLVLVKIVFGYVLLICLVVCLVLLIIKKSKNYYKSVYILLIAFALTLPYLIYTYGLTGKVFYWGNSGGMSLYWMSTPYDQEYGDWKTASLVNSQFPVAYQSTEGDSLLKLNHSKEVSFIVNHNEVERDALFKQAAIRNIKSNPKKFIRNYYYNMGRLFFNFPYSYAYQDGETLNNIINGSLILWACVITAIISIVNWRRMIYPVKFVLLITLVYLVLTTALSAYPRQLDVVVPVLLFWMAIIIANLPKIKLKLTESEIEM